MPLSVRDPLLDTFTVKSYVDPFHASATPGDNPCPPAQLCLLQIIGTVQL